MYCYFDNWNDAIAYGTRLLNANGRAYIYPNGALYFVTSYRGSYEQRQRAIWSAETRKAS